MLTTTAVSASIVLGMFWGLWHVPTLIAQRALEPSALAVTAAIVGPVPLAVLYTWLLNSTHHSVLLMWLFHTTDAVTQYLLPRLPTPTDDLLIIGAEVLVVVLTWPTNLGRRTSGRSRRQAHDAYYQPSRPGGRFVRRLQCRARRGIVRGLGIRCVGLDSARSQWCAGIQCVGKRP